MSQYQSNLELLNKLNSLLNDYIQKNDFNSEEEFKQLIEIIYNDSLIIGKYINFLKPHSDNQSNIMRYYKVWSDMPPNFFPGTILIDMTVLARDCLRDITNYKVKILQEYGEINEKVNFKDDETIEFMSFLGIEELKNIYKKNIEDSRKINSQTLSNYIQGYIKVMNDYKDDLLKLENPDSSSNTSMMY